MNTELFHPAPQGLPIAIHPPRGSSEVLKALESCDWNNLGKGRNGELLRAGALWLYGFLDESHSIAQGIHSVEGSYWHALMHRSEGDFSNSKYWYRRVGNHPIFPDLLEAVRRLEINGGQELTTLRDLTNWDPLRVVDAMEQAARGRIEGRILLQSIAQEEYNLLMSYCMGHL